MSRSVQHRRDATDDSGVVTQPKAKAPSVAVMLGTPLSKLTYDFAPCGGLLSDAFLGILRRVFAASGSNNFRAGTEEGYCYISPNLDAPLASVVAAILALAAELQSKGARNDG